MHVNKSFPSKMAVQSPPIPEGDEEEVKWGGVGLCKNKLETDLGSIYLIFFMYYACVLLRIPAVGIEHKKKTKLLK